MLYPDMMSSSHLTDDTRARIQLYQSKFSSPLGAYTSDSRGFSYARERVANFISQRDGVTANADKIYMTNGASEGVRIAMRLIIRDSNDGILVPIPQYPLYSALITLSGAKMVEYYLDEENDWALDVIDLKKRIAEARAKGINLRALTLINPGNPTGQVLSEDNLKEIIKLCFQEKICLMADEVYQENIYKDGAKFYSARKVLHEMGEPYSSSVELFSLHTISKGYMGECGLRGGYMETHNLDPEVEEMLIKLKSIELCSNTIGQVATVLMLDPPMQGVECDETVEQYLADHNHIK